MGIRLRFVGAVLGALVGNIAGCATNELVAEHSTQTVSGPPVLPWEKEHKAQGGIDAIYKTCSSEPMIMVMLDIEFTIGAGKIRMTREDCRHEETREKCDCIVRWYRSLEFSDEASTQDVQRLGFQGLL